MWCEILLLRKPYGREVLKGNLRKAIGCINLNFVFLLIEVAIQNARPLIYVQEDDGQLLIITFSTAVWEMNNNHVRLLLCKLDEVEEAPLQTENCTKQWKRDYVAVLKEFSLETEERSKRM